MNVKGKYCHPCSHHPSCHHDQDDDDDDGDGDDGGDGGDHDYNSNDDASE